MQLRSSDGSADFEAQASKSFKALFSDRLGGMWSLYRPNSLFFPPLILQ